MLGFNVLVFAPLFFVLSVKINGELSTPPTHAIVQELCESRGVRPNEPSGFRGHKELLNRASALVTTCP